MIGKRKLTETDDNSDPLQKRLRKDDVQPEQVLMELSFESNDEDNDNDLDIEIVTAGGNECENELNVSTSKKKRNKFIWTIHSEWEDLDKALDFLENEGFVSYDSTDLKCGQQFYFRYKLIPKERKTWCAQRYTLLLPSDSMKVIILRNQHVHDHEKLLEGKDRQSTEEIIEFITDLFKCGTTKSADIIDHLDNARTKRGLFSTEKNPVKRQIEYMLRKYQNSQAPPMLKLGDLLEWCDQNMEFPSDIDEAFVFAKESSSFDEEISFRFAFSTPRLLEELSHQKTICIDATYKLNWHGFPLMVHGTVDRTKRFHPFVYACCSHERTEDFKFIFKSTKAAIAKQFKRKFEPGTLIADGADAIRGHSTKFLNLQSMILCALHM